MRVRVFLPLLMMSVFLVLFACSGMDDDTLAVVNAESVSLEEFTSVNPVSRFSGKDEDFINEKVDDFIKRILFTRAAVDQGFDQDPEIQALKTATENRQMVQYVYERAIVDEVISEAALREQYEKASQELNARHILIQHTGVARSQASRSQTEALSLVEKIKARLDAGEDFAALAGEYTDDPSGKTSGGSLGWFSWGTMVGPFQDAAFALKVGSVSDPVTTDFGYHIIKLEDRRAVERGSFEEEKAALSQQARRSKAPELRNFANNFLASQKEAAGFKLDTKNIHSFYMIFEKSTYKTLPLDEAITNLAFAAPLFSLNGQDHGGAWVVDQLKDFADEQKPRVSSENQLLAVLDQMVTQSLILEYGYAQNYDKEDAFVETITGFVEKAAYDLYVKRVVNEAVEPSDDELMAFYESKKGDRYLDKQKVKVREIFVKDSLLAVDLNKRIVAGEDIGFLAGRHTERKTAKEKQGELPPFQEGRYGQMGKAAFSMQPGEISGPIQLGNGYSIVKLEEIIPEGPKPYSQVRGRVKNDLSRELREARTAKLFKELKREYSVKINYAAVNAFYAATEEKEKS